MDSRSCAEVTTIEFMLAFPQWCPVLASMILAVIPWLRWRFSLRTLLIATTLVAVVLGIIVWAVR